MRGRGPGGLLTRSSPTSQRIEDLGRRCVDSGAGNLYALYRQLGHLKLPTAVVVFVLEQSSVCSRS